MTVSKRPNWACFRYDFVFRKKRYSGTTHQITRADAELVEREIQLRLRHEAGNISQFFPSETPKFSDWAKVFIAHKQATLSRPDHVEWCTKVVLRFFGAAPPGGQSTAAEPFHDLRLGDVIAEPEWILRFEQWMHDRPRCGPQSRNHYRGVLRRMFALAMQPKYRKATGVAMNPFVGLENDQTQGRTIVLDPPQVKRLLSKAPYHVRLAIAISALMPKLRLANILALEWTQFTPDPRETKFRATVPYYVTIHRHKTARRTKRPLVSAVSAQLRVILKDAYQRAPTSTHVVTYRGRGGVKSIREGVQAACQGAKLPYGRDVENGITFYAIRHSAATLMSLGEVDPLRLRDAMGHTDLATTMKYRHLRPSHELATLERLSKTLDIAGIVTGKARSHGRK